LRRGTAPSPGSTTFSASSPNLELALTPLADTIRNTNLLFRLPWQLFEYAAYKHHCSGGQASTRRIMTLTSASMLLVHIRVGSLFTAMTCWAATEAFMLFAAFYSVCMWAYSDSRNIRDKKVQQSWQTSALAMHLHLARLVSMPGIFCLLPSSSGPIVILVFYLFSAGISEQNAWELWVWIQSESTGLTLPLRVTPMNNPVTLITSTVPGLHFCCADSYMRSSANFRIVLSESQNASPLDAELGPDFSGKWPFKIIQGHPFRRQWRATKGLHSTT